MKTIIYSTFHLTDQSSWQEVLFLVRGLRRYRRRTLCIEVARVITTNHGPLPCQAAITVPGRELHFRVDRVSEVGRVLFDWAHLLANEDYYECRI